MGQFILKNIQMTLDPSSIRAAIREISKLKSDLEEALSELARQLTEYGVDVAKMHIAQFGATDSGALEESITGEYVKAEHAGAIGTDVEYAILVEYGTGIVGANAPHPGIDDKDWINPPGATIGGETYSSYDQNGHGSLGWWYPSERGRYQPKDGGPRMAWTKGMPSRPFMYSTLKDLMEYAETNGGMIIAEYIP